MVKVKRPIKKASKKRSSWPIPAICLVFIGLAAAVWFILMNGSTTETAVKIPPKKIAPDFERLIGAWVRPDGGYVIEISKIYPNGQVDAAYFNPRPIHVSRANISDKGGIIELFIELQGKGYPGSTYTLKYSPDSDVMVGIYFQAVIQQQFDVYFQRK